jgi:hypothetical protein
MSPSDYFDTMLKGAVKLSKGAMTWDPSVVVNQVLCRLKEQRMPPEVVVGIDARNFLVAFRILPAWVRDPLAVLAPWPVPAAMKPSNISMHVDLEE